jgi:cytochrome subunit of sulfide dehydrogenase
LEKNLKNHRATSVLLLALASPLAWAQSAPDLRAAAVLASNCANCHGTAGVSPSIMPSLAGLPKTYLVQQMKAFRSGERPATLMHQLAKGYTDEQVELMAEYFSRQRAQ